MKNIVVLNLNLDMKNIMKKGLLANPVNKFEFQSVQPVVTLPNYFLQPVQNLVSLVELDSLKPNLTSACRDRPCEAQQVEITILVTFL